MRERIFFNIRPINVMWILFACGIVLLDQWSKAKILSSLIPFQPLKVTPFFDVLLSFNTGAAFSLLDNASGWQHWLFGSLAVIVSLVITVVLLRQPRQHILLKLGLALILGGALGNLYDRLTRGFVVDFLHFHWGDWSFAIFNLADTAICIGAGLLFIEMLLPDGGQKTDDG